jgi:hypothetical protein
MLRIPGFAICVFSLAAFAISLLCITAGTRPGFLEDAHIVTVRSLFSNFPYGYFQHLEFVACRISSLVIGMLRGGLYNRGACST